LVPDREALALDILADAHRTGKTLTQEEFKEALKEELRHKVDLARLAGAVTAFATGQDIDIATKTATNAVENNFVPLILGAAAVGSTLWTGYDVFTTYQEEGAEAAVKKLVVYGVVGVVTYGTGKYVIKGVQYFTATAAWDAYVSSSPLMIKLSTKLSEAGHRVMRSSLGQRVFQQTSDKITSGFGVTSHGVSRKVERGVRSVDELQALKNPLKVNDIVVDKLGRKSQKFIGEKATVAINPDTGKIISVYPTSTKLAERLKK
jgi:hypothetical protein